MERFVQATEAGVCGEESATADSILARLNNAIASNSWTRERLFWTCAIHLALHEFDAHSVLWHLAQRVLLDTATLLPVDCARIDDTEKDIFESCELRMPHELPTSLPELPATAPGSLVAATESTHIVYARTKFIRLAQIIQVTLRVLADEICALARLVQSTEWRHVHLPQMYRELIDRGKSACSASVLRRWGKLADRLEADARLDEMRSRSQGDSTRSFLRTSTDTVQHRPFSGISAGHQVPQSAPKIFVRPTSFDTEATMDADDAARILQETRPAANPAKVLWRVFRTLWADPDKLCPRMRVPEFISTPFDLENVMLPVDYSLQKTRLYTRLVSRTEMDSIHRCLKTLGQTWREFLGAEAPSEVPVQRAPMIFPRVTFPTVLNIAVIDSTRNASAGSSSSSWEVQFQAAIVRSAATDARVVLQSLPACMSHMIRSAIELKNGQRVFLAAFLASVFDEAAFPTARSIFQYLQTGFDGVEKNTKSAERLDGINSWLANKRQHAKNSKPPYVEKCCNIIKGMIQIPDFPLVCPYATEPVENLRTTGAVVDIEDLATRSCKSRLGIFHGGVGPKSTQKDANANSFNPVQAWVKSRNAVSRDQ